MSAPTAEQARAAVDAMRMLVDALVVAMSMQERTTAGELYALAMSAGSTLKAYEMAERIVVSSGFATKDGHLLALTERGKARAADLKRELAAS